MRLASYSFLLQKAGLESKECEDSIGIRWNANRFCIADGATEGFGSRRWSKLLTKHWAICDGLLDTESFMKWVSRVGERFARYWQKKTLPWYAEEKALKGAFAAFAGIQFTSAHPKNWQGIAQGDCCIFHIRQDSLLHAFPLEQVEQFNNNPILIPSISHSSEPDINIKVASGELERGDRILLMSDAVAAWFLAVLDEKHVALSSFWHFISNQDRNGLTELMEVERKEKRLKNDDIAIIAITVSELE